MNQMVVLNIMFFSIHEDLFGTILVTHQNWYKPEYNR